MSVKVIDRGWNKLMKGFKELDGSTLKVGLQEGDTNAEGISLAKIAAIHEFGTTKIPSRPFMRQTYTSNVAELKSIVGRGYDAAYEGRVSVNLALQTIGTWYQEKMKAQIRAGNFTPLKPETIKAKGSSAPLIDTATMLNSIRYVVEK